MTRGKIYRLPLDDVEWIEVAEMLESLAEQIRETVDDDNRTRDTTDVISYQLTADERSTIGTALGRRDPVNPDYRFHRDLMEHTS